MPHALIVEDEPDIRRILVSQVKAQGHSFEETSGLEDARNLLGKHAYDFILLDLKIPYADGDPIHEENGESFIRDIRDHVVNKHAGIIVVTSVHDPITAVDCIKQGADDYIPKPLEGGRRKLRECIQTALNCRRKRIEADANGAVRGFTGGTLSFVDGKILLDGILLCASMETNQAKVLHGLATWDGSAGRQPLAKELLSVSGVDPSNQVGEGAVTRAISSINAKLRKELGARGVEFKATDFIINSRGRSGYKFAEGIRIEFPQSRRNGSATPAGKATRKRKP